MVTFKDLLTKQPMYKNFENNPTAQVLFKYLTYPDNIRKMQIANSKGEAALTGILDEIETIFHNPPNFDLNEDHTRQFVGSIVGLIFRDLNYITDASKAIQNGKYFKNASNFIL